MYVCESKVVLNFTRGAEEFLKGYTTSDAAAPRGAFLDVRGKVVAVFDRSNRSADDVLIVIEKNSHEKLLTHLKPFLFLSDVSIIETQLHVYFDTHGAHKPLPDEVLIPQKKGAMILSSLVYPPDISEGEWTLFRLKNDMPLQGVDFHDEVLLNIADDDRISYSKGCYLGQEIIARIHHRGKPAKKLTAHYQSELSEDRWVAATSRVLDPDRGEEMGFVWDVVK